MSRHNFINRLSGHRAELQRMRISSLSLFGSAARDESSLESDVDLLVEFDRSVSVFHLFRVQLRLEEILGVPRVDQVQREALNPAMTPPHSFRQTDSNKSWG